MKPAHCSKTFPFTLFVAALLISTPYSLSQTPQNQRVASTVPFVGCKSDGQLGPINAPRGKSRTISIPSDAARQIAFYQSAHGLGIFAPRGWYCFSTYGSNGESLFVSSNPISATQLLSVDWSGFKSSAIQISLIYGGTSGRFEVGDIIARVFPEHKDFVENLIAEQAADPILPKLTFVYAPYPKDRLTYRSKDMVEYETPPDTEGLGTRSRIIKGDVPIKGVAMLVGADTDLVQLSMKLPASLQYLVPIITQHVERNAKSFDK